MRGRLAQGEPDTGHPDQIGGFGGFSDLFPIL